MLYVDCATANASYIVAFDTERNYQENNKNFNYWLSGSDANLRKLVKVDTTKKIDFTVVPFDAVSDLVFYAANGEFSSYRLFHHYQVSGKSTTGQHVEVSTFLPTLENVFGGVPYTPFRATRINHGAGVFFFFFFFFVIFFVFLF